MTNHELSMQFFLQLAIILAVIRAVGLVARRVGQPQVVGEMIAGVLVGPSLFGRFFPETFARVFPAETMPILYVVAQLGLVLYMFLVGMEFDVGLIKNRLKSAASVSGAGILAPFALGAFAATFLDGDRGYFAPEASRFEAMLFLGASMSITAFPMLARIIFERGLAGTSLGTLALAAGASDDAAAWCLLAVVLASFGADPMVAVFAIGGGLVFAVLVLTVGRAQLVKLGAYCDAQGKVPPAVMGLLLMLLCLSAFWTDYIGIYAVFGAFVLGIAMPRGVVTREIGKTLEPVTTNFLLPLFFVYSGLKTRLDLVSSPELFGVTAILIAIACLGKGVACYGAARWHGESHQEAMAIGALMNSRGLMELIILGIGLDRHIITPTLFTMMVMMAVVTTLMATPIFEWIYGKPNAPVRTSLPPLPG